MKNKKQKKFPKDLFRKKLKIENFGTQILLLKLSENAREIENFCSLKT